MTDSYSNIYPQGKGADDYEELPMLENLRHTYVEANRARLMPWAEHAMPEIATGKDLIRLMPTALLWALQSRWFQDREVGWKAKQIHWDKLISFWRAGIPERVVAEHLRYVIPDVVIELADKSFAPHPGAHRQHADQFDLKATRNGVTKYYEVKHTRGWKGRLDKGAFGPKPGWLWVAKLEQVSEKASKTEAWIWLNENMTEMRIIKAATRDKWELFQPRFTRTPETWYAAPLELWDYKNVRRSANVTPVSGNRY